MAVAPKTNKHIKNNNWWECNHEAPHYVIFSRENWRQLDNEGLKREEVTGSFVPPTQAHIPSAAPYSLTPSVRTGFIWLRAGPGAGPCEQSKEP